MFKHRGAVVSAWVLALGLSGCSTLVSLLEPNSPKIYGGTRMSLDARAAASSGETPPYGWTWYPLMLVDLPLSAVTDTALLPVTIFMEPDEESLRSPRASVPVPCEVDTGENEKDDGAGRDQDEE